MKSIRFLKRKEIDEQKWNLLINRSVNSFPYALTWYLDSVAEHWDALVTGDYEAVMPLPWMRKFGIKCVYQPFFCQQLGLFYENSLKKEIAREFIDYVIAKYAYVDLNLNPSAKEISSDLPLKIKKNLLLPLKGDYSSLKGQYSENHRRNISKAGKSRLQIIRIGVEKFIDFYIDQIRERQDSFKPKHAKVFRTLVTEIMNRQVGEINAAVRDGALLSVSLLLSHQDRIINIAQATSASGRNTGAAHFLFDRIIHVYSGSGKVLDFEGSSIASIARFYEGFGAEQEEFYQFKTHILDKAGIKL